MNKITKEQIEKWSDEFNIENGNDFEHPILLGDVLEKIKEKGLTRDQYSQCKAVQTIYKWGRCGFSKSLQTLIEESGWETVCMNCVDGHDCECGADMGELKDGLKENWAIRLKNPEVRDLMNFLIKNLP